MTIYCVYLTTYSGQKLPPFYIGSTSTDKIRAGYKGSVSSRMYKAIWESELKEHPSLFTSKIISTHATRKEALQAESILQTELSVVSSSQYINQSIAKKNGYFGRDVSGENNPRFGSKWTNHPRGMLDHHHSEETKRKWSISRKGMPAWNLGILNPKHSEHMKTKMIGNQHAKGKRYKQRMVYCSHCAKEFSAGTFTRNHNNHLATIE